jgi:hypothetical protein
MTDKRFTTRLLTTTVMLVTSVALVAPGADAVSAPTPGSGWARFGHFAPSQTTVDVFVDGAAFADNISYKSVSTYKPLTAGLHHFEVKPSGQPAAPDLIDVQAGVPSGGAVTIGAITTRDGIAPQIYDDALTSPPAGEALVRFIHASPGVAAVDVQVDGGPLLASDVPYPNATDYTAIPAGRYNVDVRKAGTPDVLLHIDGWSVSPGAQASLVIIDGLDGKLDVAPIRDASAVAVAPRGGVQTDGGDMNALIRPSTSAPIRTLLEGLLLAIATTGVVTFVWRRRSVSRTS